MVAPAQDLAKSEQRYQQQSDVSKVTQTYGQDKTKTVITERSADTVTVAPVKVQAESPGMAVTTVVNGDTLQAVYNPKLNTIKTIFSGKPKKVRVDFEKRTEVTADVTTAISSKVDSTGIAASVIKDKVVHTRITFDWWWIVVGIVIAILIWYVYRKVRDRLIIARFIREDAKKVINSSPDHPG